MVRPCFCLRRWACRVGVNSAGLRPVEQHRVGWSSHQLEGPEPAPGQDSSWLLCQSCWASRAESCRCHPVCSLSLCAGTVHRSADWERASCCTSRVVLVGKQVCPLWGPGRPHSALLVGCSCGRGRGWSCHCVPRAVHVPGRGDELRGTVWSPSRSSDQQPRSPAALWMTGAAFQRERQGWSPPWKASFPHFLEAPSVGETVVRGWSLMAQPGGLL